MPVGTWSFLHETVIYEYMMSRFDERQLRLKQIYKDGVLQQAKERKINVLALAPINNTRFPDVDSITINKDLKGARPAEIKFVTSSFDYHKSDKERFQRFVQSYGCIIVVKHDELPRDLLTEYPNVDIFALNEFDFISFANENFERFINRQIKVRSFKKVWLMMQSPNFIKGAEGVLPARESGIWCPSENLDCFDLAVGDTILFIKTQGASIQSVNGDWCRKREINPKWRLDEFWIGRVIRPIQNREEYCMRMGRPIDFPLWYDETETGRNDKRVRQRVGNGIRWNRVFGFHPVESLSNLDISFKYLYSRFPSFVEATIDAYTKSKSREINIDIYIALLEFLAGIGNTAKQTLENFIPEVDMPILPWTIKGYTLGIEGVDGEDQPPHDDKPPLS